MAYNIADIKYNSCYEVVMQSCTKKANDMYTGQSFTLIKDKYLKISKKAFLLIYLLLLYLCLYFTIIYIFPFLYKCFLNCFKVLDQSIELLDLVEGFLEELKLVLDLDEVFENS
jgi:hypothetical protein